MKNDLRVMDKKNDTYDQLYKKLIH